MPPTKVGPRLLNWASHLDDQALAQARQTASMPFVHPHVALMPDAHSGKGSAVGTVIPTRGAVIPAAVGVDIGCGMIGVHTGFTKSDVQGRDLTDLRLALEQSIPLSPGNYNSGVEEWSFTAAKLAELEELAKNDEVDLRHSPQWREQLGSLGGGNHFIELCLDETDQVWLFLHSGSRGVGNKIAQRHIAVAQRLCAQWWIDLPNKDLAYLPEGIVEFDRYIRDLAWAQRFAFLNRAEMMDRFGAVFAQWIGDEDHRRHGQGQCSWTVLGTARGRSALLADRGAKAVHGGGSAKPHGRHRISRRRRVRRRDPRCLQEHRCRHGRRRGPRDDRPRAAADPQPQGHLTADESEPLLMLEYDVEHTGTDRHHEQCHRVAEVPSQLGHVPEVHPIDPGDQGRGEQDAAPGRDSLDLLVLVDADLRQRAHFLVLLLRHQCRIHRERILQVRAQRLDSFRDVDAVVENVAEVAVQRKFDFVLVLAAPQRFDHLHERSGGALELHHFPRECIDAA